LHQHSKGVRWAEGRGQGGRLKVGGVSPTADKRTWKEKSPRKVSLPSEKPQLFSLHRFSEHAGARVWEMSTNIFVSSVVGS
jgi:hypothetical protein